MIDPGEKPLMEFYAGGDGDLKIRVWDQVKGEQIVWLSRPDAKKVLDYILAYMYRSKESLIYDKYLSS